MAGRRRRETGSVYVCICNALTDRDIRRATRAGATTVKEAFAALESAPQCAKCFAQARRLIVDTRLEMADEALADAAE